MKKILEKEKWQSYVLPADEKVYINEVCARAAIALGMISSCNPNKYGIILKSKTAGISETLLLNILQADYPTKGLQLSIITALGKCGAKDFINLAHDNFPDPQYVLKNEPQFDYQPAWGDNMAWAIGRCASRRISDPIAIDGILEGLLEKMIKHLNAGALQRKVRQENLLFAFGQILDACPDIPAEYQSGKSIRQKALDAIEKQKSYLDVSADIVNGTLGRLRGLSRSIEGASKVEYAQSEGVFLRMLEKE